MPLNKRQAVEYETSRSRRKYDHFSGVLDKIVSGMRETDMQQYLIDLVSNVKLEDMTEEQKAMIDKVQNRGKSQEPGAKRVEVAQLHREKLSNEHLGWAPGQTSETSEGLRGTS